MCSLQHRRTRNGSQNGFRSRSLRRNHRKVEDADLLEQTRLDDKVQLW